MSRLRGIRFADGRGKSITTLIAIASLSIGLPTIAAAQDDSTTTPDPSTTEPTSTDPTPPVAEAPSVPPPPYVEEDPPPPPTETQEERSESDYADLNGSEAMQVLEQKFQAEFAAIDSEAARELTPSNFEHFFSDTVARVDVPGDQSPQVLHSMVPLRDETEEGAEQAVDLRLDHEDAHWEAKNPLVDVSMPVEAGDALRLDDPDVGVRLQGAEASESAAVPLDGDKLFYHDAAPSTDLVILPTSRGAEILAQLRSVDSPERLSFDVDLPEGAVLRSAGDAGLEVVRDETRLATITNSSAFDARGTAVPSHLEQTGAEGFDIVTEHRTAPDVVYPVLVDPGVESWYWPSSWDWRGWSSSAWGGAGYSQPTPTQGCVAGVNWVCWWNGLYVQVGPQWQVVPGAGGEWAYHAPGPTGYVTRAVFGQFGFTRGGENRGGPYLYLGAYSPSCECWPPEGSHSYGNPYTNAADISGGPLGYNPPAPSAGYGPTTKIVFGMANNAWRVGSDKMTNHRTAALSGIQIYLGDQDKPAIAAPRDSEVPTEWIDSEELAVTTAATDATLGIARTQIVLPEQKGLTQAQTVDKYENCGGGVTSGLCPKSNLDTSTGDTAETDRFTFGTGEFYDGYQEVKLRAFDPADQMAEQVLPLYVDHSPPTFRQVSGELAHAAGSELQLASYDLHVKARDGWAAVPSSGVKSLEILLDGERAAYREQACPQDNCSMSIDWTLETAELDPGVHQVNIVAVDQLGHRSVHKLPGLRDPVADVVKATAWEGNPTAGKWLRDEWLVMNSNVTKVKMGDETFVSTTVPCPGNDEAECEQVISTTSRSTPTQPVDESYYVETGSREEDAQVMDPSEVRLTVEGTLAPNQGTGAHTSILEEWQDAPYGSNGQYKLFEQTWTQSVAPNHVETGPDEGPFYLTRTHSLWVDAATGMPLKEQTTRNGALVSPPKRWDYAAYAAEDPAVPDFELPPRPGATDENTEFQQVTHHGNEPISSEGQSELAATGPAAMRASVESIDNSDFVPYFLGGEPELPTGVVDAPLSTLSAATASSGGSPGTSEVEAPEASPTYPETVRTDKPLIYWRFGDDSGPDVADSSGHARTGTHVGSPTLNAPGAISSLLDDGAVDLNGTSQYISGYQTRRNLFVNPSVEEGTTGWGAWTGASGPAPALTQATETLPRAEYKHGTASLKVSGAKQGAGAFVGAPPVTPGRSYSAAAQLMGGDASGINLYLCYLNADLSAWVGNCSAQNVVAHGESGQSTWSRGVINGSVAPAGAGHAVVLALNASASTQNFYVDAALLESVEMVGGYFDGSSGSGASWEGARNGSASAIGPFANRTVRTFEGWAKRDTDNTLDMLLGGVSPDQGAPYLALGGEFGNPAKRVLWAPAGNNGGGTWWDNAWPGVGRWVHWALVFDEPNNTAELFIDGVSKGTRAVSGAYGPLAGKLRAGSWGYQGMPAYGFDGKLDELAVYDHALTASRIEQHREAGEGSYRRQVRSSAPALHWGLGEDSGQTVADSSGNGRDGSLVAAPVLNGPGALLSADDGSVDLDGISQSIRADYSPFVNGAAQTFEGWANRDSESGLDMLLGGHTIDQGAPSLYLGGQFNHPPGRVLWAPNGNLGATTAWENAWPGTDEWVHWALVFDESADTAELFINGISMGMRAMPASYATSPGNLRVGVVHMLGEKYYAFDGSFDELAVYERALSAGELRSNFEAAQRPVVERKMCLNSVDSVYFSDPPEPEYPEDTTDPDYIPSDPVGDEEYVAANYQEEFGDQCTPGLETPADPSLDVISVPPDIPMSEVATERYAEIAEAGQEGDPDQGIVSVELGGETVDAYIVPVDDTENSALITLPNAVLMLTGDLDTTTIDDLAEELEPR